MSHLAWLGQKLVQHCSNGEGELGLEHTRFSFTSETGRQNAVSLVNGSCLWQRKAAFDSDLPDSIWKSTFLPFSRFVDGILSGASPTTKVPWQVKARLRTYTYNMISSTTSMRAHYCFSVVKLASLIVVPCDFNLSPLSIGDMWIMPHSTLQRRLWEEMDMWLWCTLRYIDKVGR